MSTRKATPEVTKATKATKENIKMQNIFIIIAWKKLNEIKNEEKHGSGEIFNEFFICHYP